MCSERASWPGRAACAWALPLVLAACASGPRPFPPRPPLWQDQDMQPFTPRPEEYFSPFMWDGADQMLFRPIARFFAVDPAGEAVNVNALDEVPDSSFFQNRIGVADLTPEQFARGSCGDEPPLDVSQPITITGAKPNGANPGFIVEDSRGRRYLLKFDGLKQPERATSADVIGSILYHAAGYHAPCNRIVFFDRSVLRIEADATSEDDEGEERPITQDDIETVLSKGVRLPDGRYRASASLFLPGRPIGPFRYEGTRDDDPNDVVPHEDRRELRGGHVMAAWLNHFDAREQNTLDVWIESSRKDGSGHVRHYYIDFGDCLGSLWDWDGISRRLGPSGYFKIDHILRDLVTFGAVERSWERASYGPAGIVFGYYGSVDEFDPEAWFTGYPNPAFSRRSERDSAWMARILARIRPEHLRAAVAEAHIADPLIAGELLRILQARRDRILRRYLARVSPLTQPRVSAAPGGAELCLDDLALYSGITAPQVRSYRAVAYRDLSGSAARVLAPRVHGTHGVCVPLPETASAAPGAPVYQVIDVQGITRGAEPPEGPARVHLYAFGAGRYLVVGLERPESSAPP